MFATGWWLGTWLEADRNPEPAWRERTGRAWADFAVFDLRAVEPERAGPALGPTTVAAFQLLASIWALMAWEQQAAAGATAPARAGKRGGARPSRPDR